MANIEQLFQRHFKHYQESGKESYVKDVVLFEDKEINLHHNKRTVHSDAEDKCVPGIFIIQLSACETDAYTIVTDLQNSACLR